MILVDAKGHMVSDHSLQELHDFAISVGVGRGRFHGTRRGHPHYDLTVKGYYLAITHGALSLSSTRDLVRFMVRR